MVVMRYIVQLVLGVIFAFLASLALSPFFASFANGAGAKYSIFLGLVIAVIIAMAPNIRRCFGRGFLFLGTAVFLLPLSALVISGVALNETVDAAAEADKGFAVVGGALAGGLVTGAATFVGLIGGTVLLILGLILSLGGRREVVVVERK